MFNVLVPTTLIYCYASNKDVVSGRKVFDEMPMRNCVTRSAMITEYCSQRSKAKDCAFEALLLFKDMLVDVCVVKPTDTTMVCVLSTSSQLGVLGSGACVHGYIEKKIYMRENDLFVGTGLVDMNVLTWTAMVTGLAIHGRGKEAIRFLDLMRVCGVKPNAVTFTSLFSACCHAALVEEGLGLAALKRSIQIHHGELLSACNVHGDVVMGEKARKILLQLQPESISDDLTERNAVKQSKGIECAEKLIRATRTS
ncbi:hypothetical protein EZV62_027393 [Acer yangbiense]|uniref:Pentatricopeptide repeat-containing protein n=1 Tax=Acer yangbiense TaxID=1000413 RepID=A0A5C7GUE3_9ROSI|nr:hypothetical protein EZV62_027393 [Acer yangbiense]